MSGATIIFISMLVFLAALTILLVVVCIRWEREQAEDDGEWEDITETKIVETNIYDKETVYDNCTVQVLENTVTGEVSVGWWKNDGGSEE